jgi:hypothetical protein
VLKRRTVIILWLVFAFVTWNVVFDREVTVAGLAFTREQVLRYQQGQPVSSIDEAFSPRVRAAALEASGWAGAILAIGATVLLLTPRTK